MATNDNDDNPEATVHDSGCCCHVAVGYLMSGAADRFLEQIMDIDDDVDNSVGSTNGMPFSCLDTSTVNDLVIRQLAKVLGVPVHLWEAANAPYRTQTLVYDWKAHPHIGGGYMYPRVGCRPAHLEALAEPISISAGSEPVLFFAGEATHTGACCTVQAAMETGVRAAQQVKRQLGLCD